MICMVRVSAETAQKWADPCSVETKQRLKTPYTLKQVHHPAKYALKEPTPATQVLWNDFEKETDIYTKLRVIAIVDCQQAMV